VTDSGIDFVLFDLGGVLVDPGGVQQMRDLSGIRSDEELWARWLACRWVRAFEAGRCTTDEFAAGLVGDWQLQITPGEFLHAFGSWQGGTFSGASELVADVRHRVGTGFLSNMNAYQWENHYGRSELVSGFDETLRFTSFELGIVKPDPEVFEAVAGRLPAPRERVLFLDDNMVNVDAATDAGFQAARVRGVDEARATLVGAGVLPG
jgi:putative hydrolase of the HAD superfamily